MERIRSLTGVAAAVLVACGCTVTKPFTASKPPLMPQPTRPPGDALDAGVRQASATAPAAPAGPSLPSLGKLGGKPVAPRVAATEVTVLWQPRLAYLPDPSRNGEMGAGLTGNLFLFGPGAQAAVPNGKLTVDLYDETPRPGNDPKQLKERWEIDKETLKKLGTNHELLGRSYVLFLPWPTYRPEVGRVRLAVRYDPEQGFPLYATPSSLTIDTSAPAGAPVWNGTTQTVTPGQTPPGMLPPGFGPMPAPSPSPLGGPPPAVLPPSAGGVMPPAGSATPVAGFGPPAAGVTPAVGFGVPMSGAVPAGGPRSPATAGPASPAAAGPPPGGLPSIVITPGQRQ